MDTIGEVPALEGGLLDWGVPFFISNTMLEEEGSE